MRFAAGSAAGSGDTGNTVAAATAAIPKHCRAGSARILIMQFSWPGSRREHRQTGPVSQRIVAGLHRWAQSATRTRFYVAAERISEAVMAGAVEKKLADLGITLPEPTAPVANYVGFVG